MTNPGKVIIDTSWVLTASFVVTATAAAANPSWFAWPALIVALGLFGIGSVTMLWGFWGAVQRSRHEVISVAGLYFGAGSAPRDVRVQLLGATVVQLVVSITTALIRPFTSLAFGTLVPIFGLGLMGLWAARHGTFPRRHGPGAAGTSN
jgi:hypothetical protein